MPVAIPQGSILTRCWSLTARKKFSVVRVGEVLAEKGADGKLPERVKVRVEYREGKRTVKDSVTVSRTDDRWYRDEN